MKKILIFLIVFCLILAGCVPTDPQIDPNLVVLEVLNVTDKSIRYEIKNNSKDNIVLTNEWHFEYKENDNWVFLSPKAEMDLKEIKYVIEPGKSKVFTEDFEQTVGVLSSGTYRIVKEARFENSEGIDFGGQTLTGQFEVVAIEELTTIKK